MVKLDEQNELRDILSSRCSKQLLEKYRVGRVGCSCAHSGGQSARDVATLKLELHSSIGRQATEATGLAKTNFSHV